MKTKLIVIWVGVFLLVGMCLYPPWISKRHHKKKDFKPPSRIFGLGTKGPMDDIMDQHSENFHGQIQAQQLFTRPAVIRQYSFLFSPPTVEPQEPKFNAYITIGYTTELDLTRLGLQLIMIIVLTGGILFTISVLGKKKEFAQGGRYENS